MSGNRAHPERNAAATKCRGRAAARYGAAGLCCQPDQRDRGSSSERLEQLDVTRLSTPKSAPISPHLARVRVVSASAIRALKGCRSRRYSRIPGGFEPACPDDFRHPSRARARGRAPADPAGLIGRLAVDRDFRGPGPGRLACRRRDRAPNAGGTGDLRAHCRREG